MILLACLAITKVHAFGQQQSRTGDLLWNRYLNEGDVLKGKHPAGKVIVLADGRSIWGLHGLTGEILWNSRPQVKGFGYQMFSPLQFGGTTIVGAPGNTDYTMKIENGGVIVALNRNNGAVVWQHSDKALITGTCLAGRRLFITHRSLIRDKWTGFISALDAQTGKVLWNSPTDGDGLAAPTTYGSSVFACTFSGSDNLF